MRCMSDEKRYFKIAEIMEAAVKMARQDPSFAAAEQCCTLENAGISVTTRFDEVRLYSFDVIGYPIYGSCEGIYGDIFFYGEWMPQHEEKPFHSKVRVYLMKTLSTSKEAYLGMGEMVNLICYYANEFIATHLSRFD